MRRGGRAFFANSCALVLLACAGKSVYTTGGEAGEPGSGGSFTTGGKGGMPGTGAVGGSTGGTIGSGGRGGSNGGVGAAGGRGGIAGQAGSPNPGGRSGTAGEAGTGDDGGMGGVAGSAIGGAGFGGAGFGGAGFGGAGFGGAGFGGVAGVSGVGGYSGAGYAGSAGVSGIGGYSGGGYGGAGFGGGGFGGFGAAAGVGGFGGIGGVGGEFVITFDELATGTVVADQYQGVTFSTNAGNELRTYAPGNFENSQPNMICVFTGGTVNCQGDVYVDFSPPVSGIRFLALGGNTSGVIAHVDLYQGTQLIVSYNLVGGGTALSTPINLSSFSNVSRMEIIYIYDGGGIGWDDFRFVR